MQHNNNPMQIRQMIAQAPNKQQMIDDMIQNNPNSQTIINMIKNSGMSPEQYVRQYFKQNNIDLNSIMNIFKK